MVNWSPILHFYQPPTQAPGLTEWIKKTCYTPLIAALLNNPTLEMTINFAGSLALELEKLGSDELFSNLHTLWQRGQIEFLNSPLYHPLAPLTPFEVILRQTSENADLLKRLLQVDLTAGFFPPELAVDDQLAKHLLSHVEFMIGDESAVNPDFLLTRVLTNSVYSLSPSTFVVISRALTEVLRSYPKELTTQKLVKFLTKSTRDNDWVFSLSDAEIFGHHYAERLHLLEDLANQPEVKIQKVTTALKELTPRPLSQEQITASSWQTAPRDLAQNKPFPLWSDPTNELQQNYHHLETVAYEALTLCPAESGAACNIARHHYDRGISSCHTFWLSHNPWWHPDLAEAGATELIKAIRTLPIANHTKNEAEALYHSLLLQIWQLHWSERVGQYFQDYDQQRADLINGLPKLS